MSRSIASVFQAYQIARLQFAQQVAELAARPENLEQLLQGNVIVLLRNLLTDVSPSVQQNAAIAIGRLAGHCPKISELLIKHDIVRILLYFDMDKSNKYLKRAALMAIRSIVKHGAALAKSVIDIGGLDQIVAALEEFDPGVKEGACWVLGYIARHDVSLAYSVIAAGAVPLLILCLQEPEVSVRQVAASALSDICKHSPETAQVVIETGAINHLTKALTFGDAKLKKQALNCLASIAKQGMDMAETILESDKIQSLLENCGHPDEGVRTAALALIREIVKHSPEMAQLIVEAGGLGLIINAIVKNRGEAKLPGIMALGFIAGHSPQLALSVIYSKGVEALSQALDQEAGNHVGAAAAWGLGHIAMHSSEHAKNVTQAGVLPKILSIYTNPNSSDEMRDKAKEALKLILMRTDDLSSVEPLLTLAPTRILKYVVAQYSKVLPRDAQARRAFVTSGGLRKMQELLNTIPEEESGEGGSILREHIMLINQCFPDDVVKYFSPDYPSSLLDRVEQFKPALNIDPSLWSERLFSDTKIPSDVKEELMALQQSIHGGGGAGVPEPELGVDTETHEERRQSLGQHPQQQKRLSQTQKPHSHQELSPRSNLEVHPQPHPQSMTEVGRRPSAELKQPHGKKISIGSNKSQIVPKGAIQQPLAPVPSAIQKPPAATQQPQAVAPAAIQKPPAPAAIQKPPAPAAIQQPLAATQQPQAVAPVATQKPPAPAAIQQQLAPELAAIQQSPAPAIQETPTPVPVKQQPRASRMQPHSSVAFKRMSKGPAASPRAPPQPHEPSRFQNAGAEVKPMETAKTMPRQTTAWQTGKVIRGHID